MKIIDLFAGPGGLGEGFSSYLSTSKNRPFQVALSIEKEKEARKTLKLRSFFRQFSDVPEEYYGFVKGELGNTPEDELFQLPEYQDEVAAADKEACLFTLGEDNKKIFSALKDAIGKEDCIVIGGPPCQAYSLVGRAKNAGNKNYVSTDDSRNYLYKEYLKVLAKYQPLVFVMENVKGMLSANVGGKSIFPQIRNDLKDPCEAVDTDPLEGRTQNGYTLYSFVDRTDGKGEQGSIFDDQLKPSDFVIKSENYGIPQARHRVIILGIRNDLAEVVTPGVLEKTEKQVNIEQAISDLPKLRSKLSKEKDTEARWKSIVGSFPVGEFETNKEQDKIISESLLEIESKHFSTGNNFAQECSSRETLNKQFKDWVVDDNLDMFVPNHETRGHMNSDLHRYLYYSTYVLTNKDTLKVGNLPKVLQPDHKNIQSGKFADRFRVQKKGQPATTITSHISKDGHYFIHYDPVQCRSLTVREAARIQTFPDNYFFCGGRTAQYVQVGNAVPPLLANKLADIVYNIIEEYC